MWDISIELPQPCSSCFLQKSTTSLWFAARWAMTVFICMGEGPRWYFKKCCHVQFRMVTIYELDTFGSEYLSNWPTPPTCKVHRYISLGKRLGFGWGIFVGLFWMCIDMYLPACLLSQRVFKMDNIVCIMYNVIICDSYRATAGAFF